jgi:hypothetical protein
MKSFMTKLMMNLNEKRDSFTFHLYQSFSKTLLSTNRVAPMGHNIISWFFYKAVALNGALQK